MSRQLECLEQRPSRLLCAHPCVPHEIPPPPGIHGEVCGSAGSYLQRWTVPRQDKQWHGSCLPPPCMDAMTEHFSSGKMREFRGATVVADEHSARSGPSELCRRSLRNLVLWRWGRGLHTSVQDYMPRCPAPRRATATECPTGLACLSRQVPPHTIAKVLTRTWRRCTNCVAVLSPNTALWGQQGISGLLQVDVGPP